MRTRIARKIVNWVMMAAMVLVLVSGMLMHRMEANMWLGITHGVSGYLLFICAVVHWFQHRGPISRKGK